MARVAEVAGRIPFVAATTTAVLLLGLFIGSQAWLEAAAIVGGAVAGTMALLSPALTLLAWLVTGPTTNGFITAIVGGNLPALTPDRGLLALLAVVVAIRWARRPAAILPLGPVEIVMLAFFAIAAVSLLARGGTHLTRLEGGLRRDVIFLVQGYGIPFLGFFLAKNTLRGDRELRALLVTLVALGVFLGVSGVLQYFTGTTIFQPTRFASIHEGRATGTVENAVEYGMLVAASTLAAVMLLFRSRTLPERAVLLGILLLIALSVVLSKTRAVWIGLAVGLAVVARYTAEPAIRRRVIVLGVLTVVVGAAAWAFTSTGDDLKSRVMALEPIYNRIALAATSLNMIVHRPFLGGGFGRYTFLEDKRDYITSAFGVPPFFANMGVPHNEFLHILVLLGLVGFIPYAVLFVLAWRTATQCHRLYADRPGPARDVLLVLLGVFALYVVNGLAADLMFENYSSNVVYLLLGVADGLRVRHALGDA